jgi:DNA primase
MRFPDHLLDEIRTRLPLSEVVGKRVSWDKRKSQPQRGDLWACCPFHQEKSPSFHVDDRKGFYHCFGCGASGDHIRFVMETEGLSFPETVERLAAEAGVPLPARDAETERREVRRKGLAEAVELAALFFEQRFRSGQGREAREYAERRGLSPETMHAFRIGYAPAERDALTRHLVASGVDEATVVEAGLAGRPDDGRALYDRFRNRLMIPIHDARGRVVAFGGRALAQGQDPKYLNSPETPLFSKRALLFNAHRAREAAHASGSIVVVEGYLDAIAVAQAGIRGVVATLGTAFTEEQIRALWRLAPEPVICFDGDKAGIAAAHRAIDRILPLVEAGRSFNFAFLPEGKDPDELIADGGPARFLAEVKAAAPLFDVMLERELAGARLDTPERRAALEKRLDDLVGSIKDQRVAREYRVAARLRLSERLWGGGERPGGRGARQRSPEPMASTGGRPLSAPPPEPGAVDRLVLGLLVEHPGLVAAHYERIGALPLRSERHRAFRDALLHVVADETHTHEARDAAGGPGVMAGDVLARLDGPFFQILREVHGGGRRLRQAFGLLTFHPSADFVERYITLLFEKIEIAALAEEIEALTRRAGESIDEDAWERLKALNAEQARREAAYQADERALADEARTIRAAYGAGAGIEAAGG